MAITQAVDFGALVGGQLTALIEAEAQAAETSSEYIEKIGFERQQDGTLKPRMVVFAMERRDTDGKVRTHKVNIPILSLVPIPLLMISRATIDFDLHVAKVEQIDTKTDRESSGGSRKRLGDFLKRRKPSKLKTVIASTSKEQSTTRSDLKMSVVIEQSDLPEGISRLLNAVDLSVDDTTDE